MTLNPAAPPQALIGELLENRFEILKELKAGSGIVTALGRDAVSGENVVVKISSACFLGGGVRMRLDHEAAVLQTLDEDRHGVVLSFGRDGERVYLVRSFIDGPTLEEHLRLVPRMPTLDVVRIGRAVASSLEEIHALGVLHRDIKPSNIVLKTQEGTVRGATLIDFGLARNASFCIQAGDVWVGTATYAPPEQAGLIAQGIDERSDLYALGIVLFEALAGRPPYIGGSIGEVMRQHVVADLPRFAALGVAVPLPLEKIIDKLVAKDPWDRYQTASAALHDLSRLEHFLESGDSLERLVIGCMDKRKTLTEPAFIGRESELARLTHALQATATGTGTLAYLEAPSGGGKSRLFDEFARSAERADAFVLRGQGLSQAAQNPYQILNGVACDLLVLSGSNEVFARNLRTSLEGHAGAVCAALPELRSLLAPDSAVMEAPEAFGEIRTISALIVLLDALGSASRPALVLLDDAQWADPLSLKLLAQWHAEMRGKTRRTLIVLGFRSDEVEVAHPLRALIASPHILLEPLQRREVGELVASMAGTVPAQVLECVEALSDGSPFMASAVLRGMVESGALLPGEHGGWEADAAALGDIRSSRKAASLLRRRMELLPKSALDLLSVGALLGKRFEVALAASVAGLAPAEVHTTMAMARRRQILWEEARGDVYAFVHDKLREILLARLPEERRKRLHGLAAGRLEQEEPHRHFEIAFHFDAAGDAARALPYAMSAASEARAKHALSVSEEQYRIAERGLGGSAQGPEALEVARGFGDVLMLAGRYDEAHLRFERARSLAAGNPLARASIEAALGELFFKRGDMSASAEALERALASLGRGVPRGALRLRMMLCVELFIQALHTLLPRAFPLRRCPEGPGERDALLLKIYSRLAYSYWFRRGLCACAWAHLCNLNFAERFPGSAPLAQAYSEHAPVITMLPWFERGASYARRSLVLRRALRDPWGEGQSLHFLGSVFYCSSRFGKALESCREALRLLERTGDRWEVNTANWHIAYSHYRLGDLKEAVRVARATFDEALSIGDFSSAGISLAAWAKASGGEVPRDLIATELARKTDDAHTRTELLTAEAICQMRAEELDAAAATLERAHALIIASQLRQEYVAPVVPWRLTAVRMQIEALGPYAGARRRTLLSLARRLCGSGRLLASFYRNNLPHVLRECGCIAALEGRWKAARKLLAESIAVAEGMHSKHEVHLSRTVRVRLGRVQGWPESESDAKVVQHVEAERKAKALPPVARDPGGSLSLIDRFFGVLEGGREVLSAQTPTAVYQALHATAGRMFRVETCAVLSLDGSSEAITLVEGKKEARYSASLVRQAVAEGKPVAMAQGLDGSPAESLIEADVRSAMAIPILVRGKPVACVCMTHRRLGGLLGRDEEHLATFLARLAGAALENAEAYQRLSELNDSLVVQVAERQRNAEKLAAARDAAEAASRAKTQFLANVSHELRTPLGVVLGYADLLVNAEHRAEDWRELAAIILRNGRQLVGIVNDILDLSKIEAGRFRVAPTPVCIRNEIESEVLPFREACAAKELSFALDFDESVPTTVVTDAQRVRQIVSNVLGNAVKFTESGAVRMEVSLRGDGNAPAFLRIAVHDTGIGLSPEASQWLFQPFSQADGSTTRRFGGSGLGLALSKQLANALGGDLVLERSAPENGSTFVLTVDPGLPFFAIQPRAQTGQVQLGCMRVLVVDDNPDIREFLGKWLRSAGATVDVAIDGTDAVARVESAPVDAVLMDMQMPGMDGYSATRLLRERGFARPILALTAHGMPGDRERCLRAGCDDYFTKPADLTALAGALVRTASNANEGNAWRDPGKNPRI